ncbi:hypothetical protein DL769_008095 [Monosporascus sp. CRB-8-3]|nr:hypothetical protein DL769_008095 [Monosporascus sp. CRB-8-3]
MPRATQKAKKVKIDPEDAIKLEAARRQFRDEKEEHLLASMWAMDHLFAQGPWGGDTEPQGPQLWWDNVKFWNKHAPEGVRPSSAAKSMPYQGNRETPTTWPRIYDSESSPQTRAPVNARQTYRRDRFNSLRQSSQPCVRDSYDSGYGLARRHLPRRPSTDVLELSGEAEVETAGTPSPSTKYEISQQTLSDDFHLSQPYSRSQEAEGEQAQPVLTVLRTTTRVYQVHQVPPTRSRGPAHRRYYDSEQAPKPSYSGLQREYRRAASTHWGSYDVNQATGPSCSDSQRTGTREYSHPESTSEGRLARGSSTPDSGQRRRYQTSKRHGWDEDWAAETTGDGAKGPQDGSRTPVSCYSCGNQAHPSGVKRSRSRDDDKEEIRDEDVINDEDDGIETPAYPRSIFASRKRLRLSWRD